MNPTGEAGIWADLLVGGLAILAALCFLVSAIAMARVRDALSRINVLSVATGLGVVLFVVTAFVHVLFVDGFSWMALVEAAVAIGATFVVTTVASMVLARVVYLTGAELDPDMGFDDLASTEDGDPDADSRSDVSRPGGAVEGPHE